MVDKEKFNALVDALKNRKTPEVKAKEFYKKHESAIFNYIMNSASAKAKEICETFLHSKDSVYQQAIIMEVLKKELGLYTIERDAIETLKRFYASGATYEPSITMFRNMSHYERLIDDVISKFKNNEPGYTEVFCTAYVIFVTHLFYDKGSYALDFTLEACECLDKLRYIELPDVSERNPENVTIVFNRLNTIMQKGYLNCTYYRQY